VQFTTFYGLEPSDPAIIFRQKLIQFQTKIITVYPDNFM